MRKFAHCTASGPRRAPPARWPNSSPWRSPIHPISTVRIPRPDRRASSAASAATTAWPLACPTTTRWAPPAVCDDLAVFAAQLPSSRVGSQLTWARLHEQAWRYFGGSCSYVVLDNLKEGIIKPDLYEPELNPAYREVLASYGVVADPARVRAPNRKGTVENAIQHTRSTALKGPQALPKSYGTTHHSSPEGHPQKQAPVRSHHLQDHLASMQAMPWLALFAQNDVVNRQA